jgi:cell division FtsZ-interacting protein ZapD
MKSKQRVSMYRSSIHSNNQVAVKFYFVALDPDQLLSLSLGVKLKLVPHISTQNATEYLGSFPRQSQKLTN